MFAFSQVFLNNRPSAIEVIESTTNQEKRKMGSALKRVKIK